MANLTVASKDNNALSLPIILALSFLSQIDSSRKFTLNYEDKASLNSNGEYAEFTTDDADKFVNDAVLRYAQKELTSLIVGNQDDVTEWLSRSTSLTSPDFKTVEQSVSELDSHLVLRSYVVGYSLTLADIVVWGALRGNRVSTAVRKKYINVDRWFDFIESSNSWVAPVIAGLEKTAYDRRAAASAAGASFNIGLKNTENGIITRFPPEPSGYLHIGHAKAALLNDYFAHEYPCPSSRRALICRFDDTNPSKENEEFQESILLDLSLLGITPDRISYSSDYFQQMFDACIQLIKDGKAYADDTPKVNMQEQRMDGIASARRKMSVEENLARFDDMKTGSEEGLKWCIRAKISIDDPNKALRDPVIYRCNLQPHHRMGTTWKMYPTYDFCAPFLDSLEEVTHALRTNEYRDRNAQYHWMQNALGIRKVDIWDFSRLNFIKTVLSKRKLTTLVDTGVVWGWDDPRMPTVRGIRRRGMTIPALREFILKLGPSQNILNLDWTTFWATNKKHIDPIAARYTAIPKENAIIANVAGIDTPNTIEKPKHNKNTGLGTKKVCLSNEVFIGQEDAKSFSLNEEITLMNWGNAVVSNISTEPTTGKVTALDLQLHLQGDPKKTEKKITWLATTPSNLVPVELVNFDYLLTRDKIEKGEEVTDFLNAQTEFRTEAWADCNVVNLAENDIIQFDRVGYFRLDRAFHDGQPAIFFNIPTGKRN
ncbi:glutamyl-tRNA synthetase [Talaromyces proteolyticus]|uniref:glutamate--tRNA ligase n=1 Tax=Talaromyces proteolyticus TaxID=1131652 RepID=A0AAD4KDE1_9EURO|nr:glutamyl-tRNA synthetase [Talaromyces proteolyticus]KAH8688865.1 glutamyl-tRNA synthetase [Talaromyces proteolyticus]